MLKHIPVRNPEAEILSPTWWEYFHTLGTAMTIEGYALDVIGICGAATEADYYA